MNAGRSHVDFSLVQQAMDRLIQAASMEHLREALEASAVALGLNHFVALEVVDGQPQVDRALHNVADINLRAVAQSEPAAGLLARPFPIATNDALGVNELRFGIAASAFHGHRTSLLFLGRPIHPLDDGALTAMLGSVCVFASHVLESTLRLSRQSQPPQCLDHPVSGASGAAKRVAVVR